MPLPCRHIIAMMPPSIIGHAIATIAAPDTLAPQLRRDAAITRRAAPRFHAAAITPQRVRRARHAWRRRHVDA